MKRRTKIDRLREIAQILLDHGLVDFIEEMGLTSFVSQSRLEESLEDRMEEAKAEDLRQLFEDLGPTFIKLGQFLAMRPDLIPPEFARELNKLYEGATPFPANQVKKIIEKEFDCPLDEIFDEFYYYPLGAASIGQVHEAKLKTGEEVVVKVQRPDIRQRVEADMELIEKMAELIEKHVPGSEIYHPKDTVTEFKKMLRKEMDYTVEARNAQRFYDNFEDDENLIIPKVYWDHVTKKVLILENVSGKSLGEAIDGDYPKELKKGLATKMARSMLKQFFIHGIFHADPSPGNIYFREDGTLALLDFGAVGRLSESEREDMIDMFMGMFQNDTKKVMDLLLKMGEVHGEIDKKELEWDIENILELYKRRSGVLMREGANEEIMNIAKKHNLSLPADFLLMERALTETEGVCNALDPKFDFFEAAKPIVKQIIKEKYGPKAQINNLFKSAKDYHDLFTQLPSRVNNILESMEKRDFSMSIEIKGLEELEGRLEMISNRLSFTLILSSIIISSALIVLSTQQTLFGPYIFLVSVLIGLWLLMILVKRGTY